MTREHDVALSLARQAGEILRAGWGKQGLQVENKGVINPVTEIDRRSEALITDGLRAAFPGHDILAEEGTSRSEASRARWIIDPLDGTVNYIKGYPLVAVSIGLEVDGALVLGVVYNPIADELFIGERGQGAALNGAPIRVSPVASVGQAVLASGFPYDAWTNPENNAAEWERIVKKAMSVRCDGSAALDMCHVASGRLDGYWEAGTSPWDVAAGAVIVREAGGQVSDYLGGDHFMERRELVAANPVLAKELRKILTQKARRKEESTELGEKRDEDRE